MQSWPPMARLARRRRSWRDKPLSRLEWAVLAAWACILTSPLWAVVLIAVMRIIRRVL